MNSKEQALFARRLSFLIRSQVPILEALTILRKQAHTPSRRKMFDQIIHGVSNGQFLSASLIPFRRQFGDFAIDIIRVGEEGGVLDENLNYLADELQKRNALKRKVIGALVYPAFITAATLGISGVITVYIFPKIIPIFTTFHAQLPLTTRALIAISNLLIHHGLELALVAAAFVAGAIVLFKKKPPVQRFAHESVLRVPIFGKMLKNYYLANACRTMGMLLRSNFPIVRATQVTATTTSNLIYRQELSALASDLTGGRTISARLEQRADLFPSMVTEMIAIGEKTGTISDTLFYLASYYEQEVETTTKNLASSLEPMLMVMMGLIVGFVAVSVITPIYAITQNLHR